MKTDTGVYVHIPFCLRKCRYCDFCSFAGLSEDRKRDYINALLTEIDAFPVRKDVNAVSVFFGGGTPSLLMPETVKTVLSHIESRFNLQPDAEITLEANPATVDIEKLRAFRKIGINRLSIGVQSFVDSELGTLGRIHTARDAEKAFRDARNAGFDNIGMDIIYAIPGETKESLRYTLSRAVLLNPEHISAYGLILEEGTDFYRRKDEIAFISEDEEAEMYDIVRETLKNAGYEQYEVSNYAKNRKYSCHNLGYWQSRPYVGFGVAAFSAFGGKRYGNTRDLEKYMKNPTSSVEEIEDLNPKNAEYDYVMLGLRTSFGIEEAAFRKLFGHSFYEDKKAKLQKYEKAGIVTHENGVTRLTGKGFYLSDAVLTDIL